MSTINVKPIAGVPPPNQKKEIAREPSTSGL